MNHIDKAILRNNISMNHKYLESAISEFVRVHGMADTFTILHEYMDGIENSETPKLYKEYYCQQLALESAICLFLTDLKPKEVVDILIKHCDILLVYE